MGKVERILRDNGVKVEEVSVPASASNGIALKRLHAAIVSAEA
jgi:hypothetical protein